MSHQQTGVLLPDQEHNFAFSFRSTKPCVASERWELQTVPSGKEPFILHLRGVATSREYASTPSFSLSVHSTYLPTFCPTL